MGLSGFIMAKNKVSTCSTTRLLTISLGKLTCADRAGTGTDIFPVAKLCAQPRLSSVTGATISVQKPSTISCSRRPLSDAKMAGTRWTTLIPPPTFDDSSSSSSIYARLMGYSTMGSPSCNTETEPTKTSCPSRMVRRPRGFVECFQGWPHGSFKPSPVTTQFGSCTQTRAPR